LIGFAPTGKVAILTDADPLDRLAVPKAVAPLVNVTVPVVLVGSVAVRVTDWPKMEGFREEARASVGEALVTICVAVPVATLLVASPP